MPFDHKIYIQQFIQHPGNDATAYGVTIEKAQAQEGETYFQVIGVHHLTPDENRGGHYLYFDILDENNQRIKNVEIQLTEMSNNLPRGRIKIDKGENEPGTNTQMHWNETLSVHIVGHRSDKVNGLHTRHEDERGPNGETWNSNGHHSFYIIFKRNKKGSSVPPPPPNGEEPGNGTPPPTGFVKTFVVYEDDQVKVTQTVEVK